MTLRQTLHALAIVSCCLGTLVPMSAQGAESSAIQMDFTGHGAAIAALAVFILAYALVISEETIHLRKSKPVMVAAGIIWQTEERSASAKFLIAQRPLSGLLGGLWEFPGGKQEAGETLPAALKREIREELAIHVKVDEQLTIIKHAYTHFRITLHAFQARFVRGKIEHIGVADHAWVTLADVENYAFARTDRKIIAALQQNINAL